MINFRTIVWRRQNVLYIIELLFWNSKFYHIQTNTEARSRRRWRRIEKERSKKMYIKKQTCLHCSILYVILDYFWLVSMQENRIEKQTRHEKINTPRLLVSTLLLYSFSLIHLVFLEQSIRYFQNNNSSRLRALICSAIIIIQPKELNIYF